MDVRLGVDPGSPRRSTDSGYFEFTILLSNPTNQAVRALLPPERSTYTYTYWIQGPGGGYKTGEILVDSGLVIFGPSQTKRQVYDFRVADTGLFRVPGIYQFGGAWGDHWVYDSLRIDP
jgi:hypothetical protein